MGRARIALINMPVDDPIERKRRRSRAKTGAQQKTPERPRGETMSGQNRPAENERDGEERVFRLDKTAVRQETVFNRDPSGRRSKLAGFVFGKHDDRRMDAKGLRQRLGSALADLQTIAGSQAHDDAPIRRPGATKLH